MKNLLFTFAFSLLFISCFAQKNTIDTIMCKKTMQEQASKMGQLLIKKDFNSFSQYVYPKILTMMGGKQKLVEIMKKGADAVETQEIYILNVIFGANTKIINYNNELQSTLTQNIGMKVPNGRLVTKSTLIAVSTDNGQNWYFIDTAGKELQTMRKDLTNLSPELVLPPEPQPVFYQD